jgi:hypothetical protein
MGLPQSKISRRSGVSAGDEFFASTHRTNHITIQQM